MTFTVRVLKQWQAAYNGRLLDCPLGFILDMYRLVLKHHDIKDTNTINQFELFVPTNSRERSLEKKIASIEHKAMYYFFYKWSILLSVSYN